MRSVRASSPVAAARVSHRVSREPRRAARARGSAHAEGRRLRTSSEGPRRSVHRGRRRHLRHKCHCRDRARAPSEPPRLWPADGVRRVDALQTLRRVLSADRIIRAQFPEFQCTADVKAAAWWSFFLPAASRRRPRSPAAPHRPRPAPRARGARRGFRETPGCVRAVATGEATRTDRVLHRRRRQRTAESDALSAPALPRPIGVRRRCSKPAVGAARADRLCVTPGTVGGIRSKAKCNDECCRRGNG